MTMELKPCPFCGGEAKLKFGFPRQQKQGLKQAFVQCKVCKAKTVTNFQLPYESWEFVKTFVVNAWNRRADSE